MKQSFSTKKASTMEAKKKVKAVVTQLISSIHKVRSEDNSVQWIPSAPKLCLSPFKLNQVSGESMGELSKAHTQHASFGRKTYVFNVKLDRSSLEAEVKNPGLCEGDNDEDILTNYTELSPQSSWDEDLPNQSSIFNFGSSWNVSTAHFPLKSCMKTGKDVRTSKTVRIMLTDEKSKSVVYEKADNVIKYDIDNSEEYFYAI